MGAWAAVVGVLAVSTEVMPWMGFDNQAQTAAHRVLLGLSIVAFGTATLAVVGRLAQATEEQRTSTRPIVQAFLLGRASRDMPDGPPWEAGCDGSPSGTAPKID